MWTPRGCFRPLSYRDPVSLLALPWPRCNDELRTNVFRQRAPHHQLFCLISPVQPRAQSAQPNTSFQVVLQLQHQCDPGISAGAEPSWLPGICICTNHHLFSFIINEWNEVLNIKCKAPNVLFMICVFYCSVRPGRGLPCRVVMSTNHYYLVLGRCTEIWFIYQI